MPEIIIHLDENNTYKKEINLKQDSHVFMSNQFGDKSLINKGKHEIKLIKHHDMFADFFIDEKLIEEFIVLPLTTDFDIIKINIEPVEQNDFFPVILDIKNKEVSFSIKCIKPSQLSFYFLNNNNIESVKDYETLTFVFAETYCKVFKDYFEQGKFNRNKRKNLSLFKTELGIDNYFHFSKYDNSLKIKNNLTNKNYEIDFEMNTDFFIINETYYFDEPGKYEIKNLFPSS